MPAFRALFIKTAKRGRMRHLGLTFVTQS
jgi:hypothetical protein